MVSVEVPEELAAVFRLYGDKVDGSMLPSVMERNERMVYMDSLPKVASSNVVDTDLEKLTREKPLNEPDGCCVFAGSVISNKSTLEIRKLLRDELTKQL